MKRWFIVYLKKGEYCREVVEAATAIGAGCKFMELHTDIDSGSITAILDGDYNKLSLSMKSLGLAGT